MNTKHLQMLAVCGSLQRRSANRAALDVATDAATAAGVTVDQFDRLADLPPFDPDRSDEPIDAVADWRRRMTAADVVVVAAPEYAGAVAGAVKNAFDWLVGTGEMYRKPVVVLSAGTSGGEHARAMMAQTLTWQGAYVVATVGIGAPRTKSDDTGRLTDPATLVAIREATGVLLSAPAMAPDAVVALASAVVGAMGIEIGHVAPV